MKSVACVSLMFVAVAAPACVPDLRVRQDLDIRCGSDADCPGDVECNLTEGLCGIQDKTPPGFVGLPAIDPLAAGPATELVLEFEVTEALLTDPVAYVQALGEDRAFVVDESASSGRRYRMTLDPSAAGALEVAPGLYISSVSIALVDTEGNTALVGDAATVVIDLLPPAIAAPPVLAPDDVVAAGETVSIALTFNDPLPPSPGPLVRFEGGAEWGAPQTDATYPAYYVWTTAAPSTPGSYDIEVEAVDPFGNPLIETVATLTVQ